VRRIAQAAHDLGREIATPEEARTILGMDAAQKTKAGRAA
jgi:uncharacterized protein (DUF849 family)